MSRIHSDGYFTFYFLIHSDSLFYILCVRYIWWLLLVVKFPASSTKLEIRKGLVMKLSSAAASITVTNPFAAFSGKTCKSLIHRLTFIANLNQLREITYCKSKSSNRERFRSFSFLQQALVYHFLSQFSQHVGHGVANPLSDFTVSKIDFGLPVLNCFWRSTEYFIERHEGGTKRGEDFPKFGQKNEENPERSQRDWVQHTFLIQLIAFETLFNWTSNSQILNKQQGGWCLTVFGPQLLTQESNNKAAEISLY